MRRNAWLIIAAGILLMAGLAAAQTQPSTPLPVGSAMVADFRGDVTLHAPDGTTLAADRGMTLSAESLIDTGKGSVLLSLQDGAQILVKPHSHVVLKAPDQAPGYSLELAIGRIVAKVKKRLSNSPSFKMGTPTAVITVRGTRFQVEVDNKHRTRVEVYEGSVEVRGMGVGMGAVMLRPGFMTYVRPNHDPQRPEEMEREGITPGPGGLGNELPGRERTGEKDSSGEREDSPN